MLAEELLVDAPVLTHYDPQLPFAVAVTHSLINVQH